MYIHIAWALTETPTIVYYTDYTFADIIPVGTGIQDFNLQGQPAEWINT